MKKQSCADCGILTKDCSEIETEPVNGKTEIYYLCMDCVAKMLDQDYNNSWT